MHAHHRWCSERTADIPLRFRQDNVNLRHEHAAQSHSGAQADGEAHGDGLVVGAEVNGHKGQPDDAGGVHGEGDVLCFIKIGWNIARLEGVEGAAHDEKAVVAQRRHHA